MSAEDEEEVEHEATNISKRKYNTKDISKVALASIRYGVALCPTAAITTAAWIDVVLISEGDTSLIVDHNKVVRVQQRVMVKLKSEFEDKASRSEISCILFDGRIDDTILE